ncbi:MAG: glycosyltransferase family 39 protein [Chloroflexi bacterium]|nr:glycosyltransferase family 39 protein [Chloroflexota bacterium]
MLPSALALSLNKRRALPPAIALACVIFVYIFGISSLKSEPVSFDEIETLKHTITRWAEYTYTIPETINSVSERSVEHGPLYFVALNIWQRLAGYDLFSSRLLSVFFAILVVAAVYRLADLTRDREIACAAVIAIACLAYFNYYAHVTRFYALLLLMVSWLLWSYWRVISADGPVRGLRWLSLFAATALIVYVNYFGFIIIAALGFYHLLFARKDRRWLRVSLLMPCACLLFAAWLPVALRGFERSQDALDASRLSLVESLDAILSIYANGIWLLPLLAFGALLWRRKRAGPETYLLFLTGAALLLLFVMNEATTIMVARRMRYTIVLTVPFCCFLAIGLTRLPAWSWLRYLLLAVWIAASFAYFNSEDFLVYTNRREIDHDQVPHYQEFLYEADSLPGTQLPILSLHQNALVNDYEILAYYRARLPEWADVTHAGYNGQDQLIFQSKTLPFRTQKAIVDSANGLWLLHNPQQTDLQALAYYRDWFSQHYRSCGNWVEKPNAVISFYLKHEIPCQLITAAQPFALDYDNGTRLGNFLLEQRDEALTVYLWWRHAIDKQYSYSLQLFDGAGNKAAQVDSVISDDPLDSSHLDLAGLPAGDYVLKLIVYDFETLVGQAGAVLADGLRFERDFALHSFRLGA